MLEGCNQAILYAGLREASKLAGVDKPKIDWRAHPRLLERIVGFDSSNSTRKELFFSPEVVHLIFKQQNLPDIKMPWQTVVKGEVKQFKSVADIIQKFERKERINRDRKMLRDARNSVRRQKAILCFDLEAYEKDHTKLTEIGLSFIKRNSDQCETRHFILQEHENLINGVYVDNHKYDFTFGESELLPMKKAFQRLEKYIRKADAILAHSLNSDLLLLEIAGQGEIANMIRNKICLDTQMMYRSWGGTWVRIALEDLCEIVDVDTKDLHNAGNDAFLTLKCLGKMVGTKPRGGVVKRFEETWKNRRDQRRKEDELNGGRKNRGPQFEDELFKYRVQKLNNWEPCYQI